MDKALVQEVINRLLYNEKYREALIELNKKFPIEKQIKTNMCNFNFEKTK